MLRSKLRVVASARFRVTRFPATDHTWCAARTTIVWAYWFGSAPSGCDACGRVRARPFILHSQALTEHDCTGDKPHDRLTELGPVPRFPAESLRRPERVAQQPPGRETAADQEHQRDRAPKHERHVEAPSGNLLAPWRERE